MSTSLDILLTALLTFVQIYTILLVIRILLSWFGPMIDWYNPVFSILSQLTDPYLNLFRSIIPPLGGMDFSPILGFIVLNVISTILQGVGNRFLAGSL